MRILKIAAIMLFIAASLFLFNKSRYVVDGTAQVVVTRFGEVAKTVSSPGTYFRIPGIHKLHFYKTAVFDTKCTRQIIARDAQPFVIKSHAFWKIVDPVKYFKTVYASYRGPQTVLDLVLPAQRQVLAQYDIEGIAADPLSPELKEAPCRREISRKIAGRVRPALQPMGIELVNIEAVISYPADPAPGGVDDF